MPDSIEIVSLEGLTLWAQKLTNQDGHEHGNARFSCLEDNDLPPSCRHCLRRISCHGRNDSHTRCEYSETIFLCYHHYNEYSLLGSKFSTNLLFAASKCHVTIQRQWQFKMFKMSKDRMVAVVKYCWLLVQGKRGCRER